jgi:hypothetical protein
MELIFSADFSKNAQISIFMKIRPVGVELIMRAEGRMGGGKKDKRTYITKLVVSFSQFCERL